MSIVSESDNSLVRNLREISTRQKISANIAEHIEQYFAEADDASFGEASPEQLDVYKRQLLQFHDITPWQKIGES